MRVRLTDLMEVSARRPSEYLSDVMSSGRVNGDFLIIAPDVYAHLRAKYSPGLGDQFARIATPVARVLGLDCIDPETKQLKPTSGCAKRRAKLNAMGTKLGL